MTDIPRKARMLVAYLEEMVTAGVFPPGGRLPPLRELQRKFDISYGSALLGIDHLCRSGLLEKRPRSGVYVRSGAPAGERPAGRRVVSVFNVRRDGAGLYATVYCGIREAAAELGAEIRFCQLPPECADREAFEKLAEGSGGVILLSEFDRSLDALPLGKPCVGVMMHDTAGGRISVVDIDPFLAAECAADFLWARGLRSAVAVAVPAAAYRVRAELFAAAWRRRGGVCRGETCTFRFRELTGEAGRATVPFRTDEGYFFASDNLAFDYSRSHLARTGRELAADFTIVAVDGKQWINPDFHRFPTVAVDWRRIGRRALEECLERIAAPGRLPARIYLPGALRLP